MTREPGPDGLPANHPDSQYVRRFDGEFIRLPGDRTNATWKIMAERAAVATSHLPED